MIMVYGWEDDDDYEETKHCEATKTVTSTACPSGTSKMCGDKCVNLEIDRNNCGGCGKSCSIAANCLNGICVPANDCGFLVKACISRNSIGTGIAPSFMTIFGSQSFTPCQCYSACRKPATTFFTLVVDTNALGDINTICSCLVGSIVNIDVILTCPSNGYGTTNNGIGSWALYSIP